MRSDAWRHLALETLDDAYEPNYASANTKLLIENRKVFALIGAVGTPTSRVTAPLAHDAGVPFIAPFTGAEFLRDPEAVTSIMASEPEAVIMVGSYAPVARTVELARREADPVLMAVSFVVSRAGSGVGRRGRGGVCHPGCALARRRQHPRGGRYRAALSDYDARSEPDYVPLEGYLAGRLAIAGLEACGRELSRECFIKALRTPEPIDIDGIRLKFGP